MKWPENEDVMPLILPYIAEMWATAKRLEEDEDGSVDSLKAAALLREAADSLEVFRRLFHPPSHA